MSRPSTSNQPRLSDPAGYPNGEWNTQRAKYAEYWHHFDGYWLDEKVGDTAELRYPLQMNPFNMTCLLHAAFLFGEVKDGNDPLVTTVVEAWGGDEKANSNLTAKLSDLVNRAWHENDGRSLQTENGIISQVLGGCVFGVGYDPAREARSGYLPVRINTTMPEYFFPVYEANGYYDLLEAFIVFQINKRQAIGSYRVETDLAQPLYQEAWSRDEYEITVDGKIVKWLNQEAKGDTIGGFVPYSYIPHIRVGEFWGISLLDRSLGIAKEINDKYADLGDTLAENARQLPFIGNARKITVKRLSTGNTYIDLGTQAPGIDSPFVLWPQNNQANEASVRWANELLVQARTEKYTPPAVYGMDTGSQRSQLSLAISMIPLLVHIRQERSFWTPGLNQVARQIATVLAEKTDLVTREEIQRLKFRQEWAPVLPRDTEALTNEIILRLNSGLIAPETALEKLGDIRDIKTEMNLIKKWMEEKAELEAAGKPDPFAGAGMNGTQAQRSNPKEPQANITKE